MLIQIDFSSSFAYILTFFKAIKTALEATFMQMYFECVSQFASNWKLSVSMIVLEFITKWFYRKYLNLFS